jgi:hypothetical protein
MTKKGHKKKSSKLFTFEGNKSEKDKSINFHPN